MTPRSANTVTPQALHIMLSLADGDQHGYAIIQDIERRTGGELRLTASTLYGAIKRMLDAGWIAERKARAGDDPRRRTYGLTRAGSQVLREEAGRIDALVRELRRLNLVEGRGR